jgi:hypothetical protein
MNGQVLVQSHPASQKLDFSWMPMTPGYLDELLE